jgi:hypothetical protein
MNGYISLLYLFDLENVMGWFSSYVYFKSGMKQIMGIEDVTKMSGAFC